MTVLERFVSGVAWRGAGQVARQVTVLVVGIVLARIIGPREFGVVTMATVVVGFVTLFDDLGMETALIRIRDPDDVQRSSVFWLSLALGVVLGLLTAACGVPISRFFHEPMLARLITAFAFRFPISALSVVPRAELQRAMDFRTLSRLGLVAVASGGAVGIVSALIGAGAWALAFQELCTATTLTIELWLTVRWRPQRIFRGEALRGLLGFGLFLMAVQVNAYLTRNIDNVLIGRVYGKTDLALYNRGYSFIYLPLFLAVTVSTVLFPTLASLSHDMQRVKRAFLRVAGVVALLTWPAVAGLVVTADPFVRFVFGPKWVGMIPYLQVLAPVSLWQSIAALHGLLFQACGRTDLQFRVNFCTNILSLGGICIGLYWGPLGVASGYLVASIFTAVINLHYALIQVEGSLRDVGAIIWKIGICCLLMAGIVDLLLLELPRDWSPAMRLVPAVATGILVYVIGVALTRPGAWEDVHQTAKALAARSGS